MDISSILPMLLNKNGDSNPQMQNIINAMTSKGATNAQQSSTQQSPPPDNSSDPMASILSAMNASKNGKTPDIASLINLANINKKTNKPMPAGFKAIVNIAPNDILGFLTKSLFN